MGSPYLFTPQGGASTGGSGTGKNYLGTVNGVNSNGDFELGGLGGWSLFNTTLTSGVPTGTVTAGAASITTFAVTGTGKLAGNYSLNAASSAAWAAGAGFISPVFSIDTEDQTAVMAIRGQMSVLSGLANISLAAASTATFQVYIRDVTNAVWIGASPTPYLLQSSKGPFNGFMQTASNGVQYQLAIICINASAGAVSLLWDDFQFSPLTPANQTRVVSFSGSVNSQTMTANTTNLALTTIIDRASAWTGSTYIVPVAGDYYVEGTISTGSIANTLSAYVNGTQVMALGTLNSTTAGLRWSYGGLVVGLKAGDILSFRDDGAVTVTNTSIDRLSIFLLSGPTSGDEGTVVAMSLVQSSSVTPTFGTITTTPVLCKFTTAPQSDTTAGFSTSTGLYTVSVAGLYRVSCGLRFGGTFAVNSYGAIYLAKNGVTTGLPVWATASASTSQTVVYVNGSALIPLVVGDTIAPYVASNATTPVINQDVTNFFMVERLTGPVPQTSAKSVNGRWYASATALTSGTAATVVWTTKDFDTDSAMNATTGILTIPATGKYLFNTNIAASGTIALNTYAYVQFLQNGVSKSEYQTYAGGAMTNQNSQLSDELSCVVGDQIKVQFTSTATTPAIVASNQKVFFSWARIGN